jgi:AbrB family looped-hinge helix DNA binding protein
MDTTKLSSKGQVVLPSAVRKAKAWRPGQELAVESTAEGVLLKPLKPFAPTRLEEVAGCVGYRGRRLSLAEMDAAVAAHASQFATFDRQLVQRAKRAGVPRVEAVAR